MRAGELKDLTREWIDAEVAPLPGFAGAFFRGSITEAAADAVFPATSDVDLTQLFDGEPPADVPPGVDRDGWHIGGEAWSVERLRPLEAVLSDYRIGYAFRDPYVLAAGEEVAAMAALAAREFPKRHWVERRIDDACANCDGYVSKVDDAATEYHAFLIWLWAAGILAHVVLAAGRRNPTVRKRYVLARQVLERAGRLDLHEELMRVQGSGEWDAALARRHLQGMADAFDAAAQLRPRDFPAAHELASSMRGKAIDGSAALIDEGLHREAVFWIAGTYARCMMAFHAVGDEEQLARFRPGFEALREDLGVASAAERAARTGEVAAALPVVRAAMVEMLAQDSDVRDDAPDAALDATHRGGVLLRS